MTGSGLFIRPAGKADLSAVLALYAQPDMDNGQVLAIEHAESIFDRFARYPDYTLYVAETDGAVAGSFALLVMDNLGHLGSPSAIVEDVVVDPARHGMGIGRCSLRTVSRNITAAGSAAAMFRSNSMRAR